MFSTGSSAFSCLSCGIVEEMSLDLKRQSASRRSVKLTSPAPRSRSTERYSETKAEVLHNNDSIDGYDDDDDDGILEVDAVHPSKGRHVRAMSDPFDAQEELLLEVGKVVATYTLEDAAAYAQEPRSSRRQSFHAALPTLPRFPFIETKNKNCWSEPPVAIFQVRGPDYAQSKSKVESGPYLLTARGCDIFLADASSPELHEKYVRIQYLVPLSRDEDVSYWVLTSFALFLSSTNVPSLQDSQRARRTTATPTVLSGKFSIPVGRHGLVL
jgi:Protein ENHANCED DISEASE RESISTANCE 2, C-terminal